MTQNINDNILAIKALSILSDENSRNVVELLKEEDLSFSEIRKKLDLEKGTLSYHIKKLIKCGIIVNYYQKKLDSNEYSFYQLTSFAKSLLKNLSILTESISEKPIKIDYQHSQRDKRFEGLLVTDIKDRYRFEINKQKVMHYLFESFLNEGYADIELRLKGHPYYENMVWKKSRLKYIKKESEIEDLL